MSVYPKWTQNSLMDAKKFRDSRSQVIDTSTFFDKDNIDRDNELFFYAEANASYLVEAYLVFNSNTDEFLLSLNWDRPHGCSAVVQSYGPTSNGTNMVDRTNTRVSVRAFDLSVTSPDHDLNPDGQATAIWVYGIFKTGVAPGFIGPKWSASILGTDMSRDPGSLMVVTRFA